ncbi:MAG TPA: hypothetical protein VG871_14765 [Vicinamibacterales bacterium]|nr:hypothetical protein [Vicinamibacterales bacterium]
MVKRTIVSAVCAAALFLVSGVAQAQENATLTLKSGQTVTGQLVDLGGVGFTVRVNGQDQHIAQNDVAAIDFTGGTMSDADWSSFNGSPEVVLRNGQTVQGQLTDIGGTTPLRLTVNTSTGTRDFTSSDVARVIMARPQNAVATSGSRPAPAQSVAGGTTITVNANQPWTPTGITVQKGQLIRFSSNGQVQVSANSGDTAPTTGLAGRYSTRATMRNVLIGGLIGRIGTSGQPFGIGSQTSITAPASGQLFLGVNDDNFRGNQGAFQVSVAVGGGR